VRFRVCAVLLVISFALTACGGGSGSGSFLGGGATGNGGGIPSGATGGKGNVQFTLTIPGAGSSTTTSSATRIVSSAVRKPQTISSATVSITVSVNGGPPQIFNTSSCTGSPNLTCVLSVGATYGLDSFLIITWSGPNGTGTELNAAAVTINVTSGGSNTASATAGNVITVNSSADGSGASFSCASGSTTCTLREAIAEASTTSGVSTALLFQSGISTIALGSQAGPIPINGASIIILGPGATAANATGIGAPSAAANLTISGGNATGIFQISSGSLLVDGVTLANGNAANGGAIDNLGSLAIINTVLSGNTATSSGGAVYDDGSGPSTVSLSTFKNNTAGYGGAYDDEEGASFNLTSFASNTAYNASQSFPNDEGGAIFADWDLSVTASTFTGNIAGSTSISGTSGYGGAIAIEDSSMSPSITNSTFGGSSSTANFAGGPGPNDDAFGGAVYDDGSFALVSSGNTFANNTAKGGDYSESGAVDDDSCVGVASTNDTFTANAVDASASGATGDSEGGAIYVCGTSSLSSDTFTSNQALATASGFASAGALYVDTTPVTVSQTTLTKNSVTAGGCAGGGFSAFAQQGEFMTLSDVQITANTCTATGGSGSSASGGGLEIDYAFLTFQNVTVTGNTVDASQAGANSYAIGGGLRWYQGDYVNGCGQNGCSIARRPAPGMLTRPKLAQSRATVIAMLQTRSTQARAHVQARKAANSHIKGGHRIAGRAARHVAATRSPQIVAGPISTMDTVTFSNNTVNGGSGGSAYGGGADLSGSPTITNATLSNNTVTASGSNEYAVGGGFSIGSYDGNQSNCGTVTFTGTVSSNTATNAGGGIYEACYDLSVGNSTISGNSVTAVAYTADGGGGIFNEDQLLVSGTTLTGNSVAGSIASSGGGALVSYNTDTYILNSTLYKNTSSVDGGAIENLYYSSLYLTNATIYQNTATGNGGGISNDPAGAGSPTTYVYAANSILAGDTASASGSDIWNLDTFTSNGYNLVQQSSNYGSGTSNAPQTGDLIGQSPGLASTLTNTGGPTQTLADTSASPGKGVIPFANSMCNAQTGTNVDQRGYARGAGNVCDIGAYEFGGTPTAQSTVRSARTLQNLFRKSH